MQKGQVVPNKIVWLAVFLGFLADYLVTGLLQALAVLFNNDLAEMSASFSGGGLLLLALGTLGTGIGGLVAGRSARHERVLHGVLVGGMGLLAMVIGTMVASPPPFTGPEVVGQIVATGLAGLGGYASRWFPKPQEER